MDSIFAKKTSKKLTKNHHKELENCRIGAKNQFSKPPAKVVSKVKILTFVSLSFGVINCVSREKFHTWQWLHFWAEFHYCFRVLSYGYEIELIWWILNFDDCLAIQDCVGICTPFWDHFVSISRTFWERQNMVLCEERHCTADWQVHRSILMDTGSSSWSLTLALNVDACTRQES